MQMLRGAVIRDHRTRVVRDHRSPPILAPRPFPRPLPIPVLDPVPVEPAPPPPPPPAPQANPEEIAILAFICRRVPRCPDPDPTLAWG